jgi:hypothetical protein
MFEEGKSEVDYAPTGSTEYLHMYCMHNMVIRTTENTMRQQIVTQVCNI